MEVGLLVYNPNYSEFANQYNWCDPKKHQQKLILHLKQFTLNINSNKSCVLLSNAVCNIWAIWCHILLLPHKGLACLHDAQSLPCYLSPPQLWETSCQQSLSRVTWLWINSGGNALSLSLLLVVCRQSCHEALSSFIFGNNHWPRFIKRTL